ncbi:MAG: SPOR domain-containing protein [Thiotrichales bacterium]|nr:SPOR domain-containing protein [Thiotrichales bacterium]
MTNTVNSEEDVVKYRLVGALVWVLLLLLFVPSWYANPVQPEAQSTSQPSQPTPIAIAPYRLPETPVSTEERRAVVEGAREQFTQLQTPPQNTPLNNTAVEVGSSSASLPSKSPTTSSSSAQAAPDQKPVSRLPAQFYFVRLASFFELNKAKAFIEEAKKQGFDLEMKTFDVKKNGQTTKVYQVRTQKFNSFDKALKAKRNLDKIFHLKGSRILEISSQPKN